MIIKTITCHHVYNHGAYLQTYALMTYLKLLRHSVEIIDYRPNYLRGHFKVLKSSQRYNRLGLGWLYILAKLPQRLSSLKRKKAFDEFYRQYIQTTKIEYLDIEQLRSNPPVADAYIAGSDQIWNTLFKNGTDPAFYLDFGKKKIKRISYAASFATDELRADTEDFVSRMLENFNYISVRETSGLKILAQCGKSGVLTVDPVFLLQTNDWDNICSSDGKNENYVLIYDFFRDVDIEHVAKRLAQRNNLKIFSIGYRKYNYTDKDFINYGPTTFIGLIKNAKYVISNSFHGTVFSIMYKKNFFVVNRKDGLNCRMRDLLERYALTERIIDSNTPDSILFANINYANITKKLELDINNSKEFLEHSLYS